VRSIRWDIVRTSCSCGDALFERGDVVKVRDKKALAHFPRELIIAVAVPPGFPAEYALRVAPIDLNRWVTGSKPRY
jgi:hypothetical protein